ncbi:hypothetical protein DPMN_163848 [Dreissena polymorpha]|uniref:Uncharacterized protein n=1 Tax=Dreissena polymorpha TaxID=45954 RepID=A0A9D4ESK8_DREPO|nr:hypothetical protein DPMN_163848 [Dreissena polymorpha]
MTLTTGTTIWRKYDETHIDMLPADQTLRNIQVRAMGPVEATTVVTPETEE